MNVNPLLEYPLFQAPSTTSPPLKIEVTDASAYTEADFRELSLKSNVDSLVLQLCPSTIPSEVIVELFGSLTTTRQLVIGGSLPLDDNCINTLFYCADNLEVLSLDSCGKVSLEILKKITLLPNLKQALFSLCPPSYVEPLIEEFKMMGIPVTVNGYTKN